MRLSLILPTYKEAQNLPVLLERVHQRAHPYEVIVVDDDSPDHTWEVAERLKSTLPHIKVLRRIGRKGLSSAVAEGCDMATGDVFAVMDSDLQHDPSLVVLLQKKIEEGADIAVASRYREGGGVGEWVRGRRWLSKFGTFLAQKLPNVETTDPMSGFFAVRATVWKQARPSIVPEGFKILFELLAAVPRGTRLDEVPLQFQPRLHGESKLSLFVQLQFLKQALRIGLRRVGVTGMRLFTGIILALALFFLLRAWDIRPLYFSASVRESVSRTVRSIAEERGWFVSDVRVVSPDERGTSLMLIHRSHRRGPDATECWWLAKADSLQPCAN